MNWLTKEGKTMTLDIKAEGVDITLFVEPKDAKWFGEAFDKANEKFKQMRAVLNL